jgi:hypothetical protein
VFVGAGGGGSAALGVGEGVGAGVWPTGVGVGVGAGVWPTGVGEGVGAGVWPTGVGEGVWPTGVGVGVGAGVWPTGVGEGVGAGVWPIGVGEGVAVSVGVGAAVGVAVGTAQAEKPTWFVSIVTAPFRARALPDTLAPVVREMLVKARILPTNTVPVPMVAELPTCQNTLQSTPPFVTITDELLAVVSMLTILNTKTALALPWAFNVSSPVN